MGPYNESSADDDGEEGFLKWMKMAKKVMMMIVATGVLPQ
jgi:hypothetical protein